MSPFYQAAGGKAASKSDRLLGIEKVRQEGRQEGYQEGLLEDIALGLKLKFGAAGLALLPEIRTIQNVAILEAILKGLETADKIEALRRIYH